MAAALSSGNAVCRTIVLTRHGGKAVGAAASTAAGGLRYLRRLHHVAVGFSQPAPVCIVSGQGTSRSCPRAGSITCWLSALASRWFQRWRWANPCAHRFPSCRGEPAAGRHAPRQRTAVDRPLDADVGHPAAARPDHRCRRPSEVRDVGTLKAGLDALAAGDVVGARKYRDSLPDDALDRHILTWAIAMSGQPDVSSDEIAEAMRVLSQWPGARSAQGKPRKGALPREPRSAQCDRCIRRWRAANGRRDEDAGPRPSGARAS